jgi:hypothetical protein
LAWLGEAFSEEEDKIRRSILPHERAHKDGYFVMSLRVKRSNLIRALRDSFGAAPLAMPRGAALGEKSSLDEKPTLVAGRDAG